MNRNGSVAVTVLLADELSKTGSSLDLQAIQALVQEADPAVRVGIIPRLRDRFDNAVAAAAGGDADRLVLGLDSSNYSVAGLQLASRKVGLDFLGVEVINFGAFPVSAQSRVSQTEWATTILKGSIAKARAFVGSRPESLKPFIPKRMSRRALFSLPALEYRAMPIIDREHCRARDGCRQCVQTCPHDALTNVDEYLRLDKSQCTGCGLCVSACPQDAVDVPGSTSHQLSAQISAMLETTKDDDEPSGILFHCQDSAQALEQSVQDRAISIASNWLPVQVPCAGMVTWNWMLAPLTLEAAVVGVLPCLSGCRTGQLAVSQQQAALAQEMLWSLGETVERVKVLPRDGAALTTALRDFPSIDVLAEKSQLLGDPLSHESRTSVLLHLAGSYNAGPTHSFDDPQSPFGIIEVTEGCTLCGGCANACPSGALRLEETSEETLLSFDTTACVACAQCLPACPEDGVLHLRLATELQSLARGRIDLRKDSYQRCESCGKPIASSAMSQRVAAMLGDEFAATVNVISRYCIDCRGLHS